MLDPTDELWIQEHVHEPPMKKSDIKRVTFTQEQIENYRNKRPNIAHRFDVGKDWIGTLSFSPFKD